ncbi:uncharacterized protein [Watersipora subatra]|uniref:uncharacterized protein n=1 Tax=Watersipora subatra TaxID=2589382 RepID=UPI00355C45B0
MAPPRLRRSSSVPVQAKKVQTVASTIHKYKPPDINKVKRQYWQPWNETGEIREKNTEYIEIHYDGCLPLHEDDDRRLKPTRYAHNHRYGEHWETRHLIEVEKPERKLKKVERIWENEFQMFQLNQMMDKKMSVKDNS